MRIPKDISLATYIRQLIQTDKIEKFYKTDDWIQLKQEVLKELHNECQECLKKGNVRTKDLHVHHVNEIRTHPELALSKYYTDESGETKRNLIPLCRMHHNEVHDRFAKLREENNKSGFKNEERW